MRFIRCTVWIAIIVWLLFRCLKKYGYIGVQSQLVNSTMDTCFLAFIVGSLIFELIMRSKQRCPDCGKFMHEVYEDYHPKAKEFHLLYCERCDVIWDTTIPKSSG